MPAKKPVEVVEPEPVDAPETQPAAVPVVSIEQALDGPKDEGTKFWFGEILLLEFKDGTNFHVRQTGIQSITDPKLIKNLEAISHIKSNRIFKQ